MRNKCAFSLALLAIFDDVELHTGRILKNRETKMLLPQVTESRKRFSFQSEPLTLPADQVQSALAGILSQMPKDAANAAMAALWLLQVQAFRTQEEMFMVEGKYETSLADHRAMLTNLIGDGEAIVFGIKKFGMGPTAPMNFTLNDLQATLNSLHSTFDYEHGPKNSEKTNQMIGKLFDVAES